MDIVLPDASWVYEQNSPSSLLEAGEDREGHSNSGKRIRYGEANRLK